MTHNTFFTAERIRRILLLLLAGSLFTPLLFPLVFGKTFFLSPTFVTAHLFNILVELSFLAYIALVLKTRRYAPYLTDIHLISLLVLFSLLLSTLLGLDSLLGFWGGGKRGDGVFFIIHVLLFLYLLTWTIKTEREWLFFLRLAVFAGFLTGAAALIGKALFQASLLPADPIVGRDLLFGNPSALSHFMTLLIPPVLYLLFAAAVKKTAVLQTIFYAIALLLMVISVYISQSLTGQVIAAALMGAFFVFLSLYKKRFLTLLIGYGTVAIAFILIKIDLTLFWASFIRSVTYRVHVWNMIITAFLERPLLGYGWFNLRFVYDAFYDPWLNYIPNAHVDKAHNIFFEQLITTGAIGFVFFIILSAYLCFLLIKDVHRAWRLKATSSALPCGIHFNQPVAIRFVYLMFIVIFGSHFLFLQFNLMFVPAYIYSTLFLALLILVLPLKKITIRISSRIATGCLICIAPLIIFGIIYFNAQPLSINYRINKLISQVAARNLEPKKILGEAEAVRKLPIRHFELKDNLALVYAELANHPNASPNTQRQLYETTKQLNLEILQRHPLLSVNYAKLALNETLFGKKFNPRFKEDAEAYFEKALSFNPEQGAYNFQLGKFYYTDGLYEKACPLFKKLSAGTYPKIANFYTGLCAVQGKDWGKAREYIIGSLISAPGEKDSFYWQRAIFTPKTAHLKALEAAYTKGGLQKEIIPLYQALIEKQPLDFDLQRGLLVHYRANGLKEDMQKQGEKMLELFPQKASLIKTILKK